MRKHRIRQQGEISLGFLYLVGSLVIFGTLLLKHFPVYMNHYKVRASLMNLKTDPSIANKSKDDIVLLLKRRWIVDAAEGVSSDDIKVVREIGKTVVKIDYKVLTPIVSNISSLIHFEDSVEVSTR
jgi:predicted membrane protein